MISLKPFRALRPSAARAREFSVSRLGHLGAHERAALAASQPRSIAALLHDGTPGALQSLVEARALIRQPEPTVYMHRQVRAGARCTGVVALVQASSLLDGSIRPHRHAGVVAPARHDELQVDSIVIGFEDDAAVQDLIEREVNDRPLFHVLADDGATHTLWAGTRAPAVAEAFARLAGGIVLEGHGRLPRSAADAPVLAMLVPLSQVHLRSSLASIEGEIAAAIRAGADGHASVDAASTEPPAGCVDVAWRAPDGAMARRRVQLPAPRRGAGAAESIAHGRLEALLQGWVGRPVDLRWKPGVEWGAGAGEGEVLLWLPRPAMAEIAQLAAENGRLPAGSTWLDPRIRSGLWMADRSEAATTIAR